MPDKETILDKPFVIVGDEDRIAGFRALGFKACGVKSPEGAKEILTGIAKDGAVAVCLVQDDIYKALGAEIDHYRRAPLPVFIPFSKDKTTEVMDGLIKEIRLKATGTV